MAAIDTSGFQPRTLDKVERLLDLLDEMQRHPDLKGKLAMHGGTAINLFIFDMPAPMEVGAGMRLFPRENYLNKIRGL